MPAPTIPPAPDTTPRTAPPAPAPAELAATNSTGPWPYRPGDWAQLLYMGERETVLANAVVRVVTPHPDGGWVVTAVLSDPRSVFALTPHATHAAMIAADPRVTIGTDHARRSA